MRASCTGTSKRTPPPPRLTLLFSDALIRGEAVECGPVRSLA